MALPTNGRVILDTTAGEIEIELWSKVRPNLFIGEGMKLNLDPGNSKSMSELSCSRYGGFVSSS